jgi:hypothetical protein
MAFLRKKERRDHIPSLAILCRYVATKIFLLGLLFAVTCLFLGGKRSGKVANQIAQIFGKILHAISSKC